MDKNEGRKPTATLLENGMVRVTGDRFTENTVPMSEKLLERFPELAEAKKPKKKGRPKKVKEPENDATGDAESNDGGDGL